jgi:hypothetical protein
MGSHPSISAAQLHSNYGGMGTFLRTMNFRTNHIAEFEAHASCSDRPIDEDKPQKTNA